MLQRMDDGNAKGNTDNHTGEIIFQTLFYNFNLQLFPFEQSVVKPLQPSVRRS